MPKDHGLAVTHMFMSSGVCVIICTKYMYSFYILAFSFPTKYFFVFFFFSGLSFLENCSRYEECIPGIGLTCRDNKCLCSTDYYQKNFTCYHSKFIHFIWAFILILNKILLRWFKCDIIHEQCALKHLFR